VWLEKWGWLVREAQGWYGAEKERRRGVVALYNLRRLGMGGPVPLGSTGHHDPRMIRMSVWPRTKSPRSIMIEDKMSEMRA